MSTFPRDGYEFGLCLTHDLDRPYKTLQAPYYALRDRRPGHLRALLPGANSWWQFDAIRELESDLGVRSAFYVLRERRLRERPPRDWLDPVYWIEALGRYDPDRSPVREAVRELDADGWEIGLHGSLGTHRDTARLWAEKRALEDLLGHPVSGGRQHHLRVDRPETWRRHVAVGLRYDTSLGSSTEIGFQHGYDLRRPFDDEFVVFPLTVMDAALATGEDAIESAWERVEALLEEAAANNAVMTVLWHPRNFCEVDFPGHRRLYRRTVERARELGAWIGPPGDLYRALSPQPATDAPTDGEAAPRRPLE